MKYDSIYKPIDINISETTHTMTISPLYDIEL